MVLTWAVIDPNGVVDNLVLWDGVSEWTPGPGYSLVDVTARPHEPRIGGTYDDKTDTFADAPPPEPEPLTDLEVLTAKLIEKGYITADDVKAADVVGEVVIP